MIYRLSTDTIFSILQLLYTRTRIPIYFFFFPSNEQLMPGGVSSPVRAFKSVGGNPVVFDKVKGAYAWDVDGNKYIDYVGTWGPAILGHADDDVLDAVKATMDKGKCRVMTSRVI